MSNYERPKKTYTDFLNEVLENQGFNSPSIQEKLRNYTKVENINELKKDDHVRYFIWNNNDDKLKFRTGGFIKLIKDDYFILTNKKNFNWSVQKKIQSNKVSADNNNEIKKIKNNARFKMPDRRKGYIQKAQIGDHKVYLHTGEYDDGKIGEIFIETNKEGELVKAMMNYCLTNLQVNHYLYLMLHCLYSLNFHYSA